VKTSTGEELTFPVLLLSDIPEFQADGYSLSRGHVSGGCKVGDRLLNKEGFRIVDQSGMLCTIEQALVKEVRGPAIRTWLNIGLTWLGLGVRTVVAELTVKYLKTIDIEEAKALILPLAESASEVVDTERTAYSRAERARTIPELISAVRSLTA